MEQQEWIVNDELAKVAMSGMDLLRQLDIPKPVLDRLRRERGLSYVRINNRTRVYLIDDIADWLKQ